MIDRAVCLNLDLRFGERPRITAELAQHGIDVRFFLAGSGALREQVYDHVDIVPPPRAGDYPAWLRRPCSYNAFLCFRAILRQALEDRVETLLLLEDDVSIQPDFGQVLPLAWAQLQAADPDWEMLYLGANHTFARTTQVAPQLLRCHGSGCFHAVVLRQRVLEAILALPMEHPIDCMVARHIHPRGHSYATWPSIAWARPGFSYCEGRDVDYSHFFPNKGCA